MPDSVELRIHGVSGTPPRNMLYTDPLPVGPDGPDGLVEVYQRFPAEAGIDIRAFHWGGVTSNSWWSVFWILLAPFMLANLAGWVSTRVSRAQTGFVRLAGMGLTALFVSQAVTVGVAIPVYWMRQRGLPIEVQTGMAVGLAVLVSVGFLGLVLLTTLSPYRHGEGFGTQLLAGLKEMVGINDAGDAELAGGGATVDPAGDPALRRVTSPAFLAEPGVVGRLRRSHLGFGWSVIAVVVALVCGVAPGVALVIAVLLVGWIVVSSFRPNLPLWWFEPVAGLIALGFVLIPLARGAAGSLNPPEVHRAVFYIAVAAVLFAIPVWLSSGSRIWNGYRAVGAYVLSILSGAVLGIALAMGMEQLLQIKPMRVVENGIESTRVVENGIECMRVVENGIECMRVVENGAGWVAVAALGMMMLLLFWGLWIQTRPASDVVAGGLVARVVRRVMLRVHKVLLVASVYLVVVAGIGLAALYGNRWQPEGLGNPDEGLWHWWFIGFGVVAGVLIAFAVFRATVITRAQFVRLLPGVAGGAGVLVLLWYGVRSLWALLELGPPPSTGLVGVATIVAVLVPGGAIINSMVRGLLQGPGARRKVGVIWDVGSFWPRWFHPLAPPSYGPFVIDKLRDQIADLNPDVVSAHSQGSIISLVTLYHRTVYCGDDPRPFISYGSQIGRLYPGVFPNVGLDAAVAEVAGGPWINLWRTSDPVGGHWVDELGEGNRIEPTCASRCHSGYEPTPAFAEARGDLLDGG